jgi:hypothetical protein
VLTADYDLWIHIDDAEALNRAAAPFGLVPTRDPAEARRFWRYSLENDEIVDVLVARSVPMLDGQKVTFDEGLAPTPAGRARSRRVRRAAESRRSHRHQALRGPAEGRRGHPDPRDTPREGEVVNEQDRARVHEISERQLSIEEFDAYVNAPLGDDERQAILRLHEWFCRRYPTVAERLAYARRSYRRWVRR